MYMHFIVAASECIVATILYTCVCTSLCASSYMYVSAFILSYQVQAKFGDYNREIHKPGCLAKERMVPQRWVQVNLHAFGCILLYISMKAELMSW